MQWESTFTILRGLPCGSVLKSPPDNAAHMGLIPGSGRSPGEGNGNSLQYSCLGNPMNRGAWWATVFGGCKESDTTEECTMIIYYVNLLIYYDNYVL